MNRIIVRSYEEILNGVSPDRISQTLSPDDHQKASRFYHKEDRDRFIAARLLLSEELGRPPMFLHANQDGAIALSYNMYGKPELKGNPVKFNWSHSGNLIALAIGNAECGVDIEVHHSRPPLDMNSLCTMLEREWIEMRVQGGWHDKKEAFLTVWTAKEATLKALGTGLSIDPRNVEVTFPNYDPNTWVAAVDGSEFTGQHRLLGYDAERYALSWCSTLQPCEVVYGSRISNM